MPITESVIVTTSTTIPTIPVENTPDLNEQMIYALLGKVFGDLQGAQSDDDVIITKVFKSSSSRTIAELEQERLLDVKIKMENVKTFPLP